MTKLTTQELERIYELTFKYGWLEAEERQEGWLPDAAYQEKYRLEGELGPLINSALSKMSTIYEWWLENHQKAAWIETMKQSFFKDPEDLQFLVLNFENWGEFTNAVYLITSEIERNIPNTGKDLFTYAISTDDNGVAYIFSLVDQYYDILVEKADKILGKLYNLWASAFGVREAYPKVQEGYQSIQSAIGSSLSKRIVGFQIGLNTAHSTGTMADHLIEGLDRPGSGKEMLDELSSGPHLQDWTRDLTSVLGHEPGFGQVYEDKSTYYEPELGRHLGKVIEILANIEKTAIFEKFWKTFASNQVDLQPEFAKIIDDNFWELLA